MASARRGRSSALGRSTSSDLNSTEMRCWTSLASAASISGVICSGGSVRKTWPNISVLPLPPDADLDAEAARALVLRSITGQHIGIEVADERVDALAEAVALI